MTMTDNPRLTIYEIINEKRHEIYLGATELPIFELINQIDKKKPKAIRHWDLAEATSVRSVEFDLGPREAKRFLEEYVQSRLPAGWRYLTGD